jgi:hypothetical protein
MKNSFYRNKNKVFVLGILVTFLSVVLACKKWGIEPEETIAGFLCAFGTGTILLSFNLKKTKN